MVVFFSKLEYSLETVQRRSTKMEEDLEGRISEEQLRALCVLSAEQRN